MRLREAYRDRSDAGRALAEALRPELAGESDALVLALPRGGVPVAYEVARAFHLPMDVWVVRKLGFPGRPELAFGAIGPGGVRVLNPELRGFVNDEMIEAVETQERAELERRERTYRGDRPPPDVKGRTVVLVDDGVATGSTLLAAVRAVRACAPRRIVVAVPVASREAEDVLSRKADAFVCPWIPEPLAAISMWYRDFSQTEDDEVRALLARREAERSGIPVKEPAPTHADG